MKKFIKYLVWLMILVGPVSAEALTGTVSLTCDKSKLSAGESMTCTIKGTGSDGAVSTLSAQIKVSDNLELVNVVTSGIWQGSGDNGNIQLYTDVDKTDTFDIGTFTVKVKDGVTNSNESVSVNDIKFYDAGYEAVNVDSKTVNVRVPSTNNDLSGLSVTDGTITFSPSTLEYSVTIDKTSTTINATKQDDKSAISGDIGEKKLEYGVNTFKINVTSESGASKTYILNITRPDYRSAVNTLKSLSISEGKISFKENTTSYKVSVAKDISSIKVSAELKDSKASFVEGYGPRTVTLKDGSNSIVIKVKAENGSEKSYTINIEKEQSKSGVNTLKQLYLSSGVVELKPDTLEYEVKVPFVISELEIKAEPTDEKAKVEGVGKYTLEVGENKFEIKVTAENGDLKTYVILVTRKAETNDVLDSNNKLKSLKVKGHELDFNKNTNNYEIKMGKFTKLDIIAKAESEKAKVTILGNEDLEVGSEIRIVVTSEDGKNNIYKVTLIEDKNTLLPVGVVVFIVGALSLIVALVYRNKKSKNDTDELSSDII